MSQVQVLASIGVWRKDDTQELGGVYTKTITAKFIDKVSYANLLRMRTISLVEGRAVKLFTV